MSKIKVLYIPIDRDPEYIEIENRLREFQNIVRGHIEIVTLKPGLALVCNEEGKLNGMKPNLFISKINDMVCGPVVIVGVSGEEFISVSDDEICPILNQIEFVI